MKIAVIGGGISGLAAAYLLQPQHEVWLYEAGDYAGGHSRTINVATPDGAVAVDTGFIVFNHKNYPLLTALFAHLGVAIIPSNMSFSASINPSHQQSAFEYSSQSFFAQRRNLLRPKAWGMVRDILRFNRQSRAYLASAQDISLGAYLQQLGLGAWFNRYYLQAMGAAIWSCSTETILAFPARIFLRFFDNHGLLTVNDQPQWHTVQGGSICYVKKLIAPLGDRVLLNQAVRSVVRHEQGVTLHDCHGQQQNFDKVIFACHADQALKLLAAPTAAEQAVLGAFTYQVNDVVVHSDARFMPHNRRCWASWNYRSDQYSGAQLPHQPCTQESSSSVSLSYWMNLLQSLPTPQPILVTLNPSELPAAHLIHDQTSFTHPIFTAAAIAAQEKLPDLQGQQHSYFCGAYHRYGFHEDGLGSAVGVAQKLGAVLPWI